jgi:hypothetical protein
MKDPQHTVRELLEEYSGSFKAVDIDGDQRQASNAHLWELTNWSKAPPGPRPFTVPESCGRPVTLESMVAATRGDPSLRTLRKMLRRVQNRYVSTS